MSICSGGTTVNLSARGETGRKEAKLAVPNRLSSAGEVERCELRTYYTHAACAAIARSRRPYLTVLSGRVPVRLHGMCRAFGFELWGDYCWSGSAAKVFMSHR